MEIYCIEPYLVISLWSKYVYHFHSTSQSSKFNLYIALCLHSKLPPPPPPSFPLSIRYDTAEGSVDSGVVVADNNDQYNNTSSSLKYLHV